MMGVPSQGPETHSIQGACGLEPGVSVPLCKQAKLWGQEQSSHMFFRGPGQTTCPQLPLPTPGTGKKNQVGAHAAYKMFCVFAWSDLGQTTTTPSSMLGVPCWPGFPCTDPVPTQSTGSNRLSTEAWQAASQPGASESDSCFPRGLKSLLLVDS